MTVYLGASSIYAALESERITWHLTCNKSGERRKPILGCLSCRLCGSLPAELYSLLGARRLYFRWARISSSDTMQTEQITRLISVENKIAHEYSSLTKVVYCVSTATHNSIRRCRSERREITERPGTMDRLCNRPDAHVDPAAYPRL